MRNVPGRKTDIGDAEWICQLTEHGLVRPSFVAPKEIRDLREFTRYRRTLAEERTREAQRLDKVLQDAGVKLSSVASDVLGASSRAMLAALVEGTRDPAALADLAKGKLRSKLPALRTALEGRFGPRHAVLVSEILSHLDYLDEAIGRMTSAIEEAIAPFAEARDRLCSIPGIDRRIAEAVIGEIGVDMGRFPTAAHLASWAGMCPGQHESAGKQKRGTARHGDSWLQRHLAVAAMAAVCSKDTYLRAQYRRLSPRRGKQRARKAVGHSILVACWHVLASDDATYLDLGPDWFDRRNAPAVRARRKLSELRALGCQLYINDDGTTTVVLPAA